MTMQEALDIAETLTSEDQAYIHGLIYAGNLKLRFPYGDEGGRAVNSIHAQIDAEIIRYVSSRKGTRMTGTSFVKWLIDMKVSGLARSDAECARLLGISANSVVSLKKNGADTRTALACRALLHRLEPYS